MSNPQDKDPYLSELDAIDDFEGQPAEEATEVDGPTRLDVKVPPSASGGKTASVKAPRPQMPPPPPSPDPLEAEEAPAERLPPIEDFEALQDKAEGASPRAAIPAKDILELAPDLAVPLLVVMGRKSFTVQDLLELRLGQIMDLDREPLEPVDLVAGGKLIGKGELVEVDGKIGVRVLKLFK